MRPHASKIVRLPQKASHKKQRNRHTATTALLWRQGGDMSEPPSPRLEPVSSVQASFRSIHPSPQNVRISQSQCVTKSAPRRPFVTPRVYKPSDRWTGAATKISTYTRQVDNVRVLLCVNSILATKQNGKHEKPFYFFFPILN